MKVVITGPTGSIGMALIQLFLENNVEVLAICRKESTGIKYLPKSDLIKIVELNLAEYATANIQGHYDVFYHFAWNDSVGPERNNVDTQNSNISFTLDAVRLAKNFGCQMFIGAGSQAEYGRSSYPLTSKTATFPENSYGMAKLCAGQLSRILCNQLGIKHVWTRVLSVYGPYDDSQTMIIDTIRKMLLKENIVFTKGEQIWNFIYSKDAAKILYDLALKGLDGKVYCIGSKDTRPLKSFIEQMRDEVSPLQPLKFGGIPYAPNQVMHLSTDLAELEQDIGCIQETAFTDGIRETADYVKTEFGL
ncbi:NAD(P)-dependent oxidoreductase [Paenibacillus sp. E222]|uniref:NAD-dependent epimerase/dehydratase family protein n=1 Tax=Paenibacillus sp. E222 TaxID=2748863 RepID=UPI001C52C0E3|nr:NAD(P)-dependent oxidoreductase [Paenibacillus sp. E222]